MSTTDTHTPAAPSSAASAPLAPAAQALCALIKGYRLLVSPALPAACRFAPTCSQYALDALAQHGAAAGSYLALRRIGRCHPWCEGGLDPVPAQLPATGFFRRK